MIRRSVLGFLVAILFVAPGFAQVITDVPPNEKNSRFLNDPPLITMRPGLSIVGFSNAGSTGLGLRELLNTAFESPGSSEREMVLRILSKAGEPIPADPAIDQVIYTTNILQYLAFEALASFILEQNGITAEQSGQIYGIAIRKHTDVMTQFKTVLVSLARNNKLINKQLQGDPFDDYVKSVRAYNNVARALDLYLAVENAYLYFVPENPNPDLLLTGSEKITVMNRFQEDVDILYYHGLKKIHSLAGDVIIAAEDELEAGNRPLKGYLALGYASMSVQTNDPAEREKIDNYTSMAFDRAGKPVNNGQRENYWSYQTGNGSRFWAEGPYYFDLVLKDAIIFWHAIRIHKDLQPSFDPFYNNWFLNPVRWLADISTPDGSVPPVNDGNKHPIQSAGLLRWSGDYGDEETGSSFNALYNTIHQYHGTDVREDQYYLVKASIPVNQNVGNTLRSVTSPDEQQLVIRFSDAGGRNHYIYLNSEKGASIERGEGHQQPDQLQLLYYMDQYSFLTDPGYDSGDPQSNSTWNGYTYNNTMQYNASDIRTSLGFVTYQNEGGLESPYASIALKRKVSAHNEAELFYNNAAPGVDLLSGQVELIFESPEASSAVYDRTVLVVQGDRPYLIDMNDIRAKSGRNDFVMRYYGNSDRYGTQDGWFFWDHSDRKITSPTDRLFVYTVPLVGTYTEQNESIDILEYENRSAPDDAKQPYPVIRKSFLSEGTTDRFTTVSILAIQESVPFSEPEFISGSQKLSFLIHRMDSATIDLFVFNAEPSDSKRTLSVPSGALSSLELTLSQNSSFGFSRLVKQNDSWIPDPDFSVHLHPVSGPEDSSDVTDGFALFQPYPNPLQKTTTVQYRLSERAEISIHIYDLLGRRISSIPRKEQEAGVYTETWDASGLSSGIYFIRLTAESVSGSTFQKSVSVRVIK